MQGTIDVEYVMRQADQRRAWRARQCRDAEWVALKQWWRAEARVRRAKTGLQRMNANLDRAKTAWLYRAELRRAWPKWHRARVERWGGMMLGEDVEHP